MDKHVYQAKARLSVNEKQKVKQLKEIIEKPQTQRPKNSKGKSKRVQVSKQELVARMKRNANKK